MVIMGFVELQIRVGPLHIYKITIMGLVTLICIHGHTHTPMHPYPHTLQVCYSQKRHWPTVPIDAQCLLHYSKRAWNYDHTVRPTSTVPSQKENSKKKVYSRSHSQQIKVIQERFSSHQKKNKDDFLSQVLCPDKDIQPKNQIESKPTLSVSICNMTKSNKNQSPNWDC